MTEFNNKYVPKAPETYTVSYLETNQEVKKSPLSPAARSKVIRKWGGGYVSENQDAYGPCSTCGVSNKTFKINMDLRNAIGSHLTGRVYNTNQAENVAGDILRGRGDWKGDLSTGAFRKKNREDLSNKISNAVREHKNGKHIIRVVYNIPD